MDLHEALYTTRAMRRVKSDPIPLDVQARIMDAAVRAPSGGNQQNWRFLFVDDQAIKDQLAPLYRDAVGKLWDTFYSGQLAEAEANPNDPESISFIKVQKSANWLGEHFAEVPLFLFPFAQHDPTGSSIYPAVWSAMLAARAEGIGTCLTVLLSFFYPNEVNEILGVPTEDGWAMQGCVSMGYPTGTWGIAPRRPAHLVTHRNGWGNPAGFEANEPLWSPYS